MEQNKIVLDACCGSKMFWFDKQHPSVIYNDIRELDETLCDGRKLNIHPDTNYDFTNFPFDDNSFKLVVFDPPHLIKISTNSWMAKKYGKLENNWKELIKNGFDECMRVLDVYGVLIFKWSETDIKQKELFKVINAVPLIGDKGKGNNTRWYVFMKESR
ncbi:MAG: SAM-dependent methyltransferase [Candidatus Izemoplasmatales bacterium]|nr:SAM-dependent methyltransferase [Candidatus Izemoplasmatales bacterium]